MSQSVDDPVSVDSLACKKSAEAQINAHIMDIVKIFQNISDPLINDGILTKISDVEKEKLKEGLNEKELILKQKENEIKSLEESMEGLKQKMEEMEVKEKEYIITISGFEKSLSQVMAEQQAALEERNIALTHLANLEDAFKDLLEKYERAKNVIYGYQRNESILKDQVLGYEEAMKSLQEKYEEFRTFTTEKLLEANNMFEKKDKNHIAQMAKLKARILQSQVQITDLEKRLSPPEESITFNPQNLIFQPLKNLIE